MLRFILTGALAFAGAGSAAAAAKSPPPSSPLIDQIERCRAIEDDAQRLACFDRETATLLSATKSGQVSVVDRGELKAARRSLFGFSMPKLPFFSGDTSADDAPDELESTIRSVQAIEGGRYRIVINDGDAVWETTESPMRLNEPHSGDKIVIKKGAVGSYFLRLGGQLGVKGRRIR